MIIRNATAADADFIRGLAAKVFAHFGDYGRIVGEWLAAEGVHTFVVDDPAPVAFAMLGFYRIDDAAWAADLLAIAVDPSAQARGVGRRLLEHAVTAARAARKHLPVREIRLAVADVNTRARRMFTAAGFAEVPGEYGRYDGGQRALHMSRRL